MEKKFATVDEVAQYLRVTTKTVYRMLEAKKLPARKIGRQWRIDVSELNDWTRKLAHDIKPNCLVIDDEHNIGLLFQTTLAEIASDVVHVTNGKAGLELLQQRPFDLVFLDLKLPGMDGAEVFRQIKIYKPDIKIVIITGHLEGTLIDRALSYGPLCIMQKPFTLDEILNVFRMFAWFEK